MSEKSSNFGISFMNDIAIAAEKSGWEGADLFKLFGNKEQTKAILHVLRGSHEIKPVQHLIECDARPRLLDDSRWKHDELEIVEHREISMLEFDVEKIDFYISPRQKTEGGLSTEAVHLELRGKAGALNMNVLEYLLANQTAIPYDWQDKYIFFWGTVLFSKLTNDHYAAHLFFGRDNKWHYDFTTIGTAHMLHEKDCALMLKED